MAFLDLVKKYSEKLGSEIKDTFSSPANFVGKVVDTNPMSGNIARTLFPEGTGKLISQVSTPQGQEQFRQEKYAPDLLSQIRGGARQYLGNRYAAPLAQIPSNAGQLFGKDKSWSERGTGALGLLGGVATLLPDPIQDVGMPVYDYFKGVSSAQKQGQGLLESYKTGLSSLTGQTYTGLGNAISTDPKTQQIGNLAEIPITILAAHKVSKGKEAVELIKGLQPDIESASRSVKNFESFSPQTQMQIFDEVYKTAQKVIPDIVKSKEMRRLSTSDPRKWIELLSTYMEDRLMGALNPEVNIGLRTREIRRMVQKSSPMLSDEASNLPTASKLPRGQRTPNLPEGTALPPKLSPTQTEKVLSTTLPQSQSSPSTIPPGVKERGFVQTTREAAVTAPEVAKKVKGTYTPIANKQTVSAAQKAVDAGYDAAKQRVINEPLSADTNAIGQEIMIRAQSAGRFDEAIEMAETLAKKGTASGQAVQAFSVWSRLSPEGMLKYAVKQVDDANQKMGYISKKIRGFMGKGDAKLSEEEANVITNLAKQAEAAGTEEEKARFVRQAFELLGKKLPWGVSDILDEYRYNNMLSNPITHLRNIYQNMLQTYVNRPATLVAEGRPVEAIKYEIGAIKAIPDAFDAAVKAFKGQKPLGKLDEILKAGPIKPKRLGVWNIPSDALEASDQFFQTLIKRGEVARGKAEQAQATANYFLLRQDLKPKEQGYLLNKIDEVTTSVYLLRKVGLGWFIPFLKTPMNAAKQWIEYSPAGLATLPGSASKRTQLAKAMVGSTAMAFGAKMALDGRTTWNAPTDSKEKELFYAAGKKPFSFKVGNNWVPLTYLGPWAWAAGIPAAYKYYNDDSRTALTDDQLTKLAKTSSSMLEMFSQQTFVSGLGGFVKLAQGDTDYSTAKNIAYMLGQLKPASGLMRYISTVVDPIFRKPKTFVDQLKSDVPFLTKSLPAYTNPDGTPSTRSVSNYVAPYAVGIEDKRYIPELQARTQELQQNAIVNKAKKDIEAAQSGEQVMGNTRVYWDAKTGKARSKSTKVKVKVPKVKVPKAKKVKKLKLPKVKVKKVKRRSLKLVKRISTA